MRKVEQSMLENILCGITRIEGNTTVRRLHDGTVSVLLHGNEIYTCSPEGEKRFSLCGWNTPTTRSRLHALNIPVCQRKGNLYLRIVNARGEDGVIGINAKRVYRLVDGFPVEIG